MYDYLLLIFINFQNKALQSVLAAGNVVPLDRSGSLEQPMFERFKDKVSNGSWCHIFSEGKIRQNWRFEDNEPKLSVFKPGIGKIIAHSKVCPVVLPIYHKNMDKIIPEVVLPDTKTKKPSKPVSIVPRGGNEIDLYIGEPLDFTKKVEQFKLKHPNMLNQWRSTAETIELYCEITNEIRNKVLLLEAEAYGREIAASKDIALA